MFLYNINDHPYKDKPAALPPIRYLLRGRPVGHAVNQIGGHFQLFDLVGRREHRPVNQEILLPVIVLGEMSEQELGRMVVNLQRRASR